VCIPLVTNIFCFCSADGHMDELSTAATSLLSAGRQSHLTSKIVSDDDDVNKVSPNLPLSASHKKICATDNNSSEGSSPYCEGRRTSIRQSEQVYRFKEIVVRKWPGYVQLSLVTHTAAKNALNPKVIIIIFWISFETADLKLFLLYQELLNYWIK
jgi:hypothetical protein